MRACDLSDNPRERHISHATPETIGLVILDQSLGETRIYQRRLICDDDFSSAGKHVLPV